MKTYLNEWMEKRGCTEEQLAEAAKVSPKMVKKYVAGETTPSLEAMNKFARVMGISMDILTGVDPATLEEEVLEQEDDGELNTFIAEWINHFDINPVQLSEKTGIDNLKISSWLSGASSPTLIDICKIADALDILIDDLVKRAPLSAADDYTNQHVIETTDIKTAIRLQNYFRKYNVNCGVV